MKLSLICSLGVALGLLLPASAEYAEIVIDGNFGDWGSISSITNDALDNAGGVDYKEIWVANDNDYLYIRYTLHAPADPFTWQTHLFVNGDNDQFTGYHPVNQQQFGAEINIEIDTAYQSAGGSFNEGALKNADLKQAPYSGEVTQLEFRISRDVVGVSGAYENVPLISSDTIRILFQDNRGPEYMPDDGQGVVYTFAPPPPPPSYYKSITIDGSFTDWEGVPSVAVTPANNLGGVDWKEMWIANDEEYLYIKYTLHEPANPNNWNTYFFFDGDNNKSSGFNVGGLGNLGSEFMVIAGIEPYQQAGGNWSSEGSLTNLGLLQSPYNISATEFEFRVARAVTGVSGVFNGQLLFGSDTIRIMAYNEIKDENGTVVNTIFSPDAKGAIYAFAPKPPPSGTVIVVR